MAEVTRWTCSICGKPGRAHLDVDYAFYCIGHYELRMVAGSRRGMVLILLARRLLTTLDKIDAICEGTPRQPFRDLAELARRAIVDGRETLTELDLDESPADGPALARIDMDAEAGGVLKITRTYAG